MSTTDAADSTIKECQTWDYLTNSFDERDLVCIEKTAGNYVVYACVGLHAECDRIDPDSDSWALAWEVLDIVAPLADPIVDCALDLWVAGSNYQVGDIVCDSNDRVMECMDTQFWELCGDADYDPVSGNSNGEAVWTVRGDLTPTTTPLPCYEWDSATSNHWLTTFTGYHFMPNDCVYDLD